MKADIRRRMEERQATPVRRVELILQRLRRVDSLSVKELAKKADVRRQWEAEAKAEAARMCDWPDRVLLVHAISEP